MVTLSPNAQKRDPLATLLGILNRPNSASIAQYILIARKDGKLYLYQPPLRGEAKASDYKRVQSDAFLFLQEYNMPCSGSDQYPTAEQIRKEQDKERLNSAIAAAESLVKIFSGVPQDISNIHVWNNNGGKHMDVDLSHLTSFTPNGHIDPMTDRLKKSSSKPEFEVEVPQIKKQQSVERNKELEYYKREYHRLATLLYSVCRLKPKFYNKRNGQHMDILDRSFIVGLSEWFEERQQQHAISRRKQNVEHYMCQFSSMTEEAIMELVDKGVLEDMYADPEFNEFVKNYIE